MRRYCSAMPYFHATRRERLPSIFRHGLGGIDPGPTSVDCERGVYLAEDPRLAILMMIDHYLSVGAPDSKPAEELKSWVVLLIDDARIDAGKLDRDQNLDENAGSWLYRGVIDITGCVQLTADDIEAADKAGALPPTGVASQEEI